MTAARGEKHQLPLREQKPGDPDTQLKVGGYLQQPVSGVLLPVFYYYREQTGQAATRPPWTAAAASAPAGVTGAGDEENSSEDR